MAGILAELLHSKSAGNWLALATLISTVLIPALYLIFGRED
jgi:hypothetical protein